jgi:hypothetical protein
VIGNIQSVGTAVKGLGERTEGLAMSQPLYVKMTLTAVDFIIGQNSCRVWK